MKKLFYITLAFFAMSIGIVGCQNYEDVPIVHNTKKQCNNPLTITVDEAKKRVSIFLNDFSTNTRSGNSKEIGDVYAWRYDQLMPSSRLGETDNSSDTLMYIVNFKYNEGYVLLSANKNRPSVIAYIEKGNLSPYDEITNPGFKMFVTSAGEMLTSLDSIPTDTTGAGNIYTEDSLPPSERLYFVDDPLLQTKWSQSAPFNNECPMQNGIHCKAGCAPIATAQVVAYHQFPSSYSGHQYIWDEILSGSTPTTSVGQSSVAHLVHDIGVKEESIYDLNATATYPSKIRTCLYLMGFHCSYLSEYSYSRCRANFRIHRPVIINGYREDGSAGHTWVLDGGFSWREEYEVLLPNGTMGHYFNVEDFVHCNWGWGGFQNGYYWSEVFDVCYKKYEDDVFDELNIVEQSGRDFSYNLSVNYDIFPIHFN